MVSLILSNKFNDLQLIRLQEFSEKVCHDKFSVRELVAQEALMLKALKFKIPQNNLYDYVSLLIMILSKEFQAEFLWSLYHLSLKLMLIQFHFVEY